MNFVLKEWQSDNIKEFNNYLLSLENKQRSFWTKRIYGTQKPCLAINIPVLRNLAKQISKGNKESFLSKQTRTYVEDDILHALIISEDNSLEGQQEKTRHFLKDIDSWECTDVLKLKYKDSDYLNAINFSKELVALKGIFERRFAFVSLLKFAKNENAINYIFDLINFDKQETEYYVNMAIAWLLCEITIYFPEKSLKFLKKYKNSYKNQNNIFVIRKTVSKCHDSYRIDDCLKKQLKELI